MENKKCSKCKKVLSLGNFSKSKRGKLGVSSSCKECYRKWYLENKNKVKENARKNYLKNKEVKNEQSKKWREENKDLAREQTRIASKKHYALNKEKVKKKKKAYAKENSDKYIYYNFAYRATKNGLVNCFSFDEYKEVKNRNCFFTNKKEVVLDHFIPTSIGHGGNYKGNIVPINKNLNSSKFNKNPFVWSKNSEFVSDEKFNELVNILAFENCLTSSEFESFVNWCFLNKNPENKNISSIEMWRNEQKIHLPLPKYTSKKR